MRRVPARFVGRLFAVAAALVTAATLGGLVPRQARAIEALDGRVQAHGFFESQLRVISDDFREQYDLAQWYQVLNLELEVDILPDGWGAIDLMSAYVRLEARYDCVYSRGCGMFRTADTYGDRAKHLPTRISSAKKNTYHGAMLLPKVERRINTFQDTDGDGIADTTVQVLETDLHGAPIVDHHQVVPLVDIPGFSGLGDQTGADGYLGQPAFGNALNGLATLPSSKVGGTFCFFSSSNTACTGPNVITVSNTQPDPGESWALRDDDPFPFVFERFLDYKFAHRGLRGGGSGGMPSAIMGPWLPKNFVYPNATLADQFNPFDASQTTQLLRNNAYNGSIYSSSNWGYNFKSGDIDPTDPTTFVEQHILFNSQSAFEDPFHDVLLAAEITAGELEASTTPGISTIDQNAVYVRGATRAIISAQAGPTGGSRVGASKPMRPIPITDAARYAEGDQVARGLYLPSKGLRSALAGDRAATIPINFTENERAWNRGASQQDEGELKEAFVDIETLDSRLWLRLGKQNIVWGKTELFRTTDQFNPVDLALVTLGNLEETRIALWSGRAVYSLYEVGPFEDVRVEIAANIDDYESNDLGACGEPFTPNPVCDAAFGSFAHGAFGVGLAGVDKPESPWEDVTKTEFGGRIEWRWDRFSFAIADFYGYEDLPFLDRISTYERNVDPSTGRMRAMGETGPCATQPVALRPRAPLGVPSVDPGCLQAGPTRRAVATNPAIVGNEYRADAALAEAELAAVAPGQTFDPILREMGVLVTDDPTLPTFAEKNALDAHPANQQFFAAICAGTVGVSSLDPSACAATVFGSQLLLPLSSGLLTTSQVIGSVLAGSDNGPGTTGQVTPGAIALTSSTGLTQFEISDALVRLNHDIQDAEYGGTGPGGQWGGPLQIVYGGDNHYCVDNSLREIARPVTHPRHSIYYFDALNLVFDIPCHSGGASFAASGGYALGQVLTVEQQALLGCGPFFGTNCDDSGIDLLNAEASVLFQSFPGFDGTGQAAGGPNFAPGTGATPPRQWTTTNTKYDPGTNTVNGRALSADGQDRQQPGTIFFRGGPVGTVYGRLPTDSPTTPKRNIVLPGARSPFVFDEKTDALVVGNGPTPGLNPDYDPTQDGCIGPAAYAAVSAALGVTVTDHTTCTTSSGRANVNPYHSLVHPLADMGGSTQYFRSEMAALSWNFLVLLTIADREFDEDNRFAVCREDPNNPGQCLLDARGNPEPVCSLATPQHCGTVRGLLGLAGVTRNTRRAGGNGTFGRRTFVWQSGGEAVLAFERRNVLGFSMDFAEDVTKSNFSIEATWIPKVRRGDPDSWNGVRYADDYNLTLSVDRPTFVNFLNANRTFFFNAQFFFRYRAAGTASTLDLLSTFTVLAGYFQDRLLPSVTFIYDARSNTYGALPQLQYRYTEAFSIVFGAQFFGGKPDIVDMPVNGLGPASNQQGPYAYRVASDDGVSIVRSTDNVYLRLRYAF